MTIDPVQCARRSATLGVLSLSIVIIGFDPSILSGGGAGDQRLRRPRNT
jgi:hypothetical protein